MTIYRGWVNVAVAFFTNFLAMGFALYSFGVVLEPISQEFPGSGRFGASMIPMAMGISMALCAPAIGKWLTQFSLRNVMTAGCLLASIGFFLSARAVELWQLVFIFGTLIAVSEQLMGGVTAQVLVVNWFEKNRALALGISLLGLSISGIVMPHVAIYIGREGGWREIYSTFALVLLVVSPIIWLCVVGKPEYLGLKVDGARLEKKEEREQQLVRPSSYTLRNIYSDPVLWAIGLPVGIAFMGSSATLVHAFSFAKDFGSSDAHAAWFITAMAGGAACGKIFFSWLAEILGTKKAFVGGLCSQLFGYLGVILFNVEYLQVAAIFAIGLGFGGITPLKGAMVAELWGRERFAPILGAMFPLFLIFQAGGAPLAGFVHDNFHTYQPAFWMFAVSMVIGILLTVRIPAIHPNLDRYQP